MFRDATWVGSPRGQAVVTEYDAGRIGYALLGGCVCEVCEVDELYVRAAYRSRGIGFRAAGTVMVRVQRR